MIEVAGVAAERHEHKDKWLSGGSRRKRWALKTWSHAWHQAREHCKGPPDDLKGAVIGPEISAPVARVVTAIRGLTVEHSPLVLGMEPMGIQV
jgi:hypothetical protein